MPPSLYDDPLLQRYDIRVDPNLRLLFCLQCTNAIFCDTIRSHVATHFVNVPPDIDFEETLAALGVNDDFIRPTEPIARIVGLKHVDNGYKCVYNGCGRLLSSLRRIQEHFKEEHEGVNRDDHIRPATFHQVYAFRGKTIAIETDKSLEKPIPGVTSSIYISTVLARPSPSTTLYTAPKDSRLLTGFHYATQWASLIDGCDIAQLQALVAYPEGPDDPYTPLGAGVTAYLDFMIKHLPSLNTLFRRLIDCPTE
jgi:hypothetical protein